MLLKAIIYFVCFTATQALRMEYPTPQQILAARTAKNASAVVQRQNVQVKASSYLQQHSAAPLTAKVLEFAAEAKEDHGDQWVDVAMQRFNKAECPSEIQMGLSEVMPPWTILALKNGGADIGKSTNGVFQDWMRYGNYCGNQMHGTGYGDVKQGEAACSAENGNVAPYEVTNLHYDVCDDCGLDSGCALHDSSWVHQSVDAVTTEKGPTMCAANEAFQTRMLEASHSGCTKKFRDGHGVPEEGYMKLAKCAMIFAPCINYEGPSLKILEQVNPSLYRQCKLSAETSIQFLACVSVHYMNYRVPLGDYSGVKLKCTPEDKTCFIQGDARSTDHKEEVGSNDTRVSSLLERSSSSSSGGTSCGPLASPSLSLCRAIARHVVVGGAGDKSSASGSFSLAPASLVAQRAPLPAQDLVALDREIASQPEAASVLAAKIEVVKVNKEVVYGMPKDKDRDQESYDPGFDPRPACPNGDKATWCLGNGECNTVNNTHVCPAIEGPGEEPCRCPWGVDLFVPHADYPFPPPGVIPPLPFPDSPGAFSGAAGTLEFTYMNNLTETLVRQYDFFILPTKSYEFKHFYPEASRWVITSQPVTRRANKCALTVDGELDTEGRCSMQLNQCYNFGERHLVSPTDPWWTEGTSAPNKVLEKGEWVGNIGSIKFFCKDGVGHWKVWRYGYGDGQNWPEFDCCQTDTDDNPNATERPPHPAYCSATGGANGVRFFNGTEFGSLGTSDSDLGALFGRSRLPSALLGYTRADFAIPSNNTCSL